ncbi:MAG: insulinase family protein, partial [Gammaproteobacteria bacterium]|nr:insulinase family protein [Gammaproteobacteria bacterium]
MAKGVHEFTLDNGLKVIIKEDHRAPVVVSQIWYKVGSSYEHSGITGISHMLEHMMFKGTGKYEPGEFSRIVAAEGGSENAFTSRDYTAYYQQLAKDRLEVSFRLEADRMTGLILEQEEMLKERDVVAEERRLRTEDKPRSRAYEQFISTAYQTSPYHHPVIGWMADINGYTLEDLQSWYSRWYQPNNAVLVVAGDVEPVAVLKLANRYFGALPSNPIQQPKPRPEVEQLGQRRITVKVPAKLPYLVMGYKTPNLSTAAEAWEPYALAVLAAVLDGDDSARLSRHLIR